MKIQKVGVGIMYNRASVGASNSSDCFYNITKGGRGNSYDEKERQSGSSNMTSEHFEKKFSSKQSKHYMDIKVTFGNIRQS